MSFYLLPHGMPRAISAIPRESVIPICDPLLEADHFDAALLQTLITRYRYPLAAEYLSKSTKLRAVKHFSIVKLIVESVDTPILAFRVALSTRLITTGGTGFLNLVTIRDLQEFAQSADPIVAKKGRIACALCGFPVAPWPAMPRTERAAFALHHLIQGMREGFR